MESAGVTKLLDLTTWKPYLNASTAYSIWIYSTQNWTSHVLSFVHFRESLKDKLNMTNKLQHISIATENKGVVCTPLVTHHITMQITSQAIQHMFQKTNLLVMINDCCGHTLVFGNDCYMDNSTATIPCFLQQICLQITDLLNRASHDREYTLPSRVH